MTVVGRKEQQQEEKGVTAAQKDLVITELRA
jgi:hypothetical protein